MAQPAIHNHPTTPAAAAEAAARYRSFAGKGSDTGTGNGAVIEFEFGDADGTMPGQAPEANDAAGQSTDETPATGGSEAVQQGGKTETSADADKVAAAKEALRPIQTDLATATESVDRSRRALYVATVELVNWRRGISDATFAKIAEEVTGRPYSPDQESSNLARVGFGIRNENAQYPAVIRQNRIKNLQVFRLAKGLKRISSAIDKLESCGEAVSTDFIVQLLCEPGSGGLSGAGDLLAGNPDQYSDIDDDDDTGSDRDRSGHEHGKDDADTDTTSEPDSDEESGTNTDNGSAEGGSTSTGDTTGATGKASAKPTPEKVAKLDTSKFLGLRELRPDELPHHIPGSVFAAMVRIEADGKPALIAATPLTKAMARILLPENRVSVDKTQAYLASLLMIGHCMPERMQIAILSNGHSVFGYADVRNSVSITAIASVGLALPLNAAGAIITAKLDRDELTLIGKLKKGEGSLNIVPGRTTGELFGIKLSAEGATPHLVDVRTYNQSQPVSRLDVENVVLDITIDPDKTTMICEMVRSQVDSNTLKTYMALEFSGHRFVKAVPSGSNMMGWTSKPAAGNSMFFVLQEDIASVLKAYRRLSAKTVPFMQIDARGLLTIELAIDCGVFTAAIPAVYPNSATRRSDFYCPFLPENGPGPEELEQADDAANGDAEPQDDDEQLS